MVEQVANLCAFGMPGGWEWLIVLVVAVLIFGRKEAQDEVTKEVDNAADAMDTEDQNSKKDTEDVLRPQ